MTATSMNKDDDYNEKYELFGEEAANQVQRSFKSLNISSIEGVDKGLGPFAELSITTAGGNLILTHLRVDRE